MHSQQLLTEIKTNLYTDPQKCISILSNKTLLNNLFHEHLIQLTQILENALNKSIKDNKSLSYSNPSQPNSAQKHDELNAQLIVCMYSIIIMKSSSKSIIIAEETPIFNTKTAIETLSKIHKQGKRQDVKKVIAALLLKIQTFNNHKNIIRDISPEFVSLKTMQKACSSFKSQCPNLYEQKITAHKSDAWGRFLSYRPFKLQTYSEIFKKLQTKGNVSTDVDALIEIRQSLKREFEYLMVKIEQIRNEEFHLYQFCEKFSELYRMRVEFPKLLQANRFTVEKGQGPRNLPSYNVNELRLKVLLQGKNQLLQLLTLLVKKLGSYWTRKLKWLYDFIIERIQIFGLQELGLSSIQQADVYVQKLTELKLLIKLTHTYYREFGDGLFPEEKLKGLLFTQEYSLYKLIEALLYNEYEFTYTPEHTRIVNYQKTKKVSEEFKNKKNLIKTINVNSKSLNINPHYDLVFQKVIQQIAYKTGEAYSYLRPLIQEALKFMATYYKRAETYFYGGNLIAMIQSCKNTEVLKQNILQLVKEIKSVLYPTKKIIKQGLEFFCEEVFENYISKKRHLQNEKQAKATSSLKICKTTFLSIHSSQSHQNGNQTQTNLQASGAQNGNKNIKKTASYDMEIEGWAKEEQKGQKQVTVRSGEMFYSIQEEQLSGQNEKQPNVSGSQMFHSFQEDEANAGDQEILMPEF